MKKINLKLSTLIKLRTIYFVAFTFMLSFALSPSISYAATDACDADYYETLKSRAWLEAQREITQNQNLIFKPDSVLAYTCFDKHLNEIVQLDTQQNLFSGSARWGNTTVGSLTGSLNALVGTALTAYYQGNYSHEYLGGRHDDSHPSAIALTGGGYECDVMNRVWMAAKCMDFIEDDTTDGFYTFDNYLNNDDRRQYPSQCPNVNDWSTHHETAVTNVAWTRDNMLNYVQELSAENCTSSEPISTGLIVNPGGYEEKVCIKPGCYYNPNNGQCNSN